MKLGVPSRNFYGLIDIINVQAREDSRFHDVYRLIQFPTALALQWARKPLAALRGGGRGSRDGAFLESGNKECAASTLK